MMNIYTGSIEVVLYTLFAAIDKIKCDSAEVSFSSSAPESSSSAINQDFILHQLMGSTYKIENDVEKIMEQLYEFIRPRREDLIYSGYPMCQESVESVLVTIKLRMLNRLKAEHEDENVYLDSIVDDALRHYYHYVMDKNRDKHDSCKY